MARVWNVKVDERMYAVQLKGRKVDVNGEKLKLSKYKKKTGLVHEEYERTTACDRRYRLCHGRAICAV